MEKRCASVDEPLAVAFYSGLFSSLTVPVCRSYDFSGTPFAPDPGVGCRAEQRVAARRLSAK